MKPSSEELLGSVIVLLHSAVSPIQRFKFEEEVQEVYGNGDGSSWAGSAIALNRMIPKALQPQLDENRHP